MGQEPLAAPFLPGFQSLRGECDTVSAQEITIADEQAGAQAACDSIDQKIDAFVLRVSNAVNEHTDGPTRKQLRAALFKNKSLSRFRRPVLGGQLTSMLDWSEILANCGVPALALLAPEADTLVKAGQDASALRDGVAQKNRNFREVGARKQLIDKTNAMRSEAHGGLKKLSFENPNLSTGFADSFFYSEPPREEEETIDEVKASIEALEAELGERKALLGKLEEEAAQAAKEAEEKKALEAAAGDLEAQAQALLAKAAAMKAKLPK